MSYQREFSPRINVGIIGAGSHCYRNILPVMNYLPVRIRAICDPNVDLGKATAAQYGCAYYPNTREMYEQAEIEAVFICVGPKLHPQLAIEALDAGKHVWVEKPISTSAAEVAAIIAHRKQQIVVVGLKKAFMPATRKAIEIVNSPKYGNLQSILAVYHMTMPANGVVILKNRETPNWLRNGVHPLGFMMAVGGKVAEVTTICNQAGHGTVILQFANGAIGNLHMSSGPQPDLESYGVYGDKWQLEIKDTRITLERGIPFVYKETTDYAPQGDDWGAVVWDTSNCVATLENKALFTQGFYDETMYFCNCVLNRRTPEKGTLEFAWEMMKVYEAGMLSGGKTIRIQ
jgi:predicted dehydrogenase